MAGKGRKPNAFEKEKITDGVDEGPFGQFGGYQRPEDAPEYEQPDKEKIIKETWPVGTPDKGKPQEGGYKRGTRRDRETYSGEVFRK